MPSNNPLIIRVAALACLALACLFYIGLPLEEDQRSSIACAQQGDYLAAFPECMPASYHLRGIGHKVLNYFGYRSARTLAGTSENWLFEPVFKLWVLAFYSLTLVMAMAACKQTLRKFGLDHVVVFALSLAALVTTSSEVFFQAEEISVLLIVVGLAMSLGDSRIIRNLAGLPLALTFSMKGVTLSLAMLAIIARLAAFPQDRKGLMQFFLSFCVFTLLVVAATFVFLPQEIRDLRDTAWIEGSQFTVFDRIKNTWKALRCSFDELPMVIVGLFAAIPVLLFILSERRWLQGACFALLWIGPVAPALIQGKGFIYHVAGFLVPSLCSIVALYAIITIKRLPLPWQAGSACIPIVLCFLFTGPVPLFGAFNYWHVVARRQNEVRLFSDWNRTYALPDQNDIFYLTAGDAAFYTQAKSYLRYFVPITLQRVSRNPRLVALDRFKEDYKAALDYHGKFIILDERWFQEPFAKLPELRHKLDTEYQRVANSVPWALYQRK